MVAITTVELGRRLPEILLRVEQGESFRVEDGGREVADLTPVEHGHVVTREVLVSRLAAFGPIDPAFADDLETITREQEPARDTPRTGL